MEVQFVLDNDMDNHLDLYSTFSLKGLESLYTSILSIPLIERRDQVYWPYVACGHFTALSL